MDRTIVDLPRPLMLVAACNWDIDWRGQSAGEGNDTSEQIVFNRLPRVVGSMPIILPREMITFYRAIRWQVQGRANAWRVPMIDPLGYCVEGGDWRSNFEALLAGDYVAPRPQVRCVAAVSAGATQIDIDEESAPEPVRVGQFLSFGDWPFAVVWRLPGGGVTGSTARIGVRRLKTAIAEDAMIDCLARGLFLATSDAMGNPEYGVDRVARPTLDFVEWMTR